MSAISTQRASYSKPNPNLRIGKKRKKKPKTNTLRKARADIFVNGRLNPIASYRIDKALFSFLGERKYNLLREMESVSIVWHGQKARMRLRYN
mgnify:CR=1 FL=1